MGMFKMRHGQMLTSPQWLWEQSPRYSEGSPSKQGDGAGHLHLNNMLRREGRPVRDAFCGGAEHGSHYLSHWLPDINRMNKCFSTQPLDLDGFIRTPTEPKNTLAQLPAWKWQTVGAQTVIHFHFYQAICSFFPLCVARMEGGNEDNT